MADDEKTNAQPLEELSASRSGMEEALRRSEATSQAILSAMPDLMFRMSGEGVHLDFHASTPEHLLADPEELKGRSVEEVLPQSVAQQYMEHIQQALATGQMQIFEYDLLFPDNRVEDFEARLVVSGENEVLAIVRNITEAKRLQAQAEEQRVLAEALRDTAAALNSTLDVDEVLNRILDNVGRVLPHTAADIKLIDDGVARVVRGRDYAEHEPHKPMVGLQFVVEDTPNLLRMFETGKPVAIPDIKKDAGWIFDQTPPWIRSHIGAPIRLRDGKVIGFINLNSPEPRFFSEAHAEPLMAFADQAAVAIQNARLHQQVQRHADHLEALRQVTLEISTELNLEELLHTIVQNALGLIGADAGGVYLYQPGQNVLESRAYVSEGKPPLRFVLKRGEGLSGKVWESGRPLKVDDYSTWEGRAAVHEEYDWQAVLAVPVSWGDEFLGTISMLRLEPGRAFSDADVDLLSLFASQASAAVQNARLFSATRESAEALQDHIEARTAELRQERQRAEAILKAVGEPVILLDNQGYILQANPAFEEQIGPITRDGHPIHGREYLLSQTTLEDVIQEAEQSIREDKLWRGDLTMMGRDGRLHDIAVTLTPLHNQEEVADAFVAAIHDVTHLKEMDRLKREFMNLVQHEMRTPITGIKGISSVILSGDAGPLNSKAHEYMSLLKYDADRLSSMSKAIVDVMRIYTGEMTPQVELVNLPELIKSLVLEFQMKMEQYQQQIEVRLPNDLPGLVADRNHLSLVLRHLLDNAVIYAGKGSRIQVDARFVDSAEEMAALTGKREGFPCMVVRVSDDGRGIATDHQIRLFEPFVRVGDAEVQHEAGSGLGLFIVRSLVALHGGLTGVQSTPGQGSTFYATWPTNAEGLVRPGSRQTWPQPEMPLSVVLATDNAQQGRILRQRLESAGYKVHLAANSEEALHALLKHQPQLLILDGRLGPSEGRFATGLLSPTAKEMDIPLVTLAMDFSDDGTVSYRLSSPYPGPITLEQMVVRINELLDRQSHRSRRVLVIDDDPDSLQLLQDALDSHQFQVQLASTPEDAHLAARHNPPDVILLDLLLGNADGYALLSEFRRDPILNATPIIVVTGYLDRIPDAEAKAVALGAARFIAKPFDVMELVDVIEEMLSG